LTNLGKQQRDLTQLLLNGMPPQRMASESTTDGCERMALRRQFGAIIAVGVVTLLSGCVERRFRVETTPPGAAVFVNNVPYGSAPVDIPFIYYGKYDITLVKDGFQTRHVKQDISAPWYQYPPIDFFAESLWPWQITDLRPLHYDLEPLLQPNLDEIKRNADELRARSKELPPPRYPDFGKDKDRPKNPATPLPPPVVVPPREVPKSSLEPPIAPPGM
jgi:hypothetical protein